MLDSDKDTTTKPVAILKEKLQHVSHPCAIIGRIIKYRNVWNLCPRIATLNCCCMLHKLLAEVNNLRAAAEALKSLEV